MFNPLFLKDIRGTAYSGVILSFSSPKFILLLMYRWNDKHLLFLFFKFFNLLQKEKRFVNLAATAF